MFFSRCSPRSTKGSAILSRTCRQASSDRQIAPGAQIPSSRAAILTPSPIRSPSASSTTSPRWMPVRIFMRLSGASVWLRSASPLATSSAQRTASTTLRNSTIAPSPVRLTTRPPCAATAGLNSSVRSARRRASVASSSAAVRRLKPTMSATRIAATFRPSLTAALRNSSSARRTRRRRSVRQAMPGPRGSADSDQTEALLGPAFFREQTGRAVALEADVFDHRAADFDIALEGPGPVGGSLPGAAGNRVDVARPMLHRIGFGLDRRDHGQQHGRGEHQFRHVRLCGSRKSEIRTQKAFQPLRRKSSVPTSDFRLPSRSACGVRKSKPETRAQRSLPTSVSDFRLPMSDFRLRADQPDDDEQSDDQRQAAEQHIAHVVAGGARSHPLLVLRSTTGLSLSMETSRTLRPDQHGDEQRKTAVAVARLGARVRMPGFRHRPNRHLGSEDPSVPSAAEAPAAAKQARRPRTDRRLQKDEKRWRLLACKERTPAESGSVSPIGVEFG